MSAPTLPDGFKWGLKKSARGGYLLMLIPADGYEWSFPRNNPNAPNDDAYFFAWVQNPKAKGALAEAGTAILRESLGSTTIVKPKVRKVREQD
jgi:hypothetical protein